MLSSKVSTFFSEEEWEAMRDVSRMLNYFVRNNKYSYVDRLANAYGMFSAVQTLEEALRDARSALGQGEMVHIPSEESFRTVIELLERNLDAAKVIAGLALAFPSRKE